MYPIRVEEIAMDISAQFFPDSRLTNISGVDFNGKFEGAITRIPNSKNDWGIAYNSAISSKGRINFTIAHEFGHYLLHRKSLESGIQCGRKDMLRWNSEYGKREAEANEFASYLLMPRNRFEEEMNNGELSLHLLLSVAEGFNVSLTAAILKWLDFTTTRAMLVVGKDGFIDWVWSSESLRRSGVYLQPKKQLIELPARSLAAINDRYFDNQSGVVHSPNVWPFREEVKEMTVHADTHDMTISLLVFPKNSESHWKDIDGDEHIFDSYDKFNSFNEKKSL